MHAEPDIYLSILYDGNKQARCEWVSELMNAGLRIHESIKCYGRWTDSLSLFHVHSEVQQHLFLVYFISLAPHWKGTWMVFVTSSLHLEPEPYKRVPIPMPMGFGWAWVRYYW